VAWRHIERKKDKDLLNSSPTINNTAEIAEQGASRDTHFVGDFSCILSSLPVYKVGSQIHGVPLSLNVIFLIIYLLSLSFLQFAIIWFPL